MYIVIIILWLLIGLIAVQRTYYGCLKTWYKNFNESYWDYHKRNNGSALTLLFIFSPVYIIGGPLTLLMFEFCMEDMSWYYKVNKK